MKKEIIISGFGGQGGLAIGKNLAEAGMAEGLNVTWAPSYGPEMRGGTANCSVVISDEEIPFAMVSQPGCCIVMNNASLAKFQAAIQPGGTLILDSSMVDAPVERTDLRVVRVPADVIAEEEGNSRGANMVLLGAYVAACGGISMDAVCRNIDHSFTGSKAKYAESNKRLARRGYDLVVSQGN